MTEEYYPLWLCTVVSDPAIRRKLFDRFGEPREIYYAQTEELTEIGGITEAMAEKVASTRTDRTEANIRRSMDRKNAYFVWSGQEHFPDVLRTIPEAPVGLFYQGTLPGNTRVSVGIVGTRLSSPYGEEVAARFGRILGEAGVAVVSGLAMGIDGAAHRGCLAGGGYPVAVLGSGIGEAYPRENASLYLDVVRNGCVMSEYGPGVPALKQHFPMRNRLISGLSDGVLVVEAKRKSGTLITVDRALEQGRNVYVIPGRITDQNSEGCNNLIRQGAMLVTDPGEILSDLRDCDPGGVVRVPSEGKPTAIRKADRNGRNRFDDETGKNKKQKNALETDTEMVYASLRLSPKHFDELVFEHGIGRSRLLQILCELESNGRIRAVSTGCYSASDSTLYWK